MLQQCPKTASNFKIFGRSFSSDDTSMNPPIETSSKAQGTKAQRALARLGLY